MGAKNFQSFDFALYTIIIISLPLMQNLKGIFAIYRNGMLQHNFTIIHAHMVDLHRVDHKLHDYLLATYSLSYALI